MTTFAALTDAGTSTPHAALAASDVGLQARPDLLLDERPHRLQAVAVTLAAAGVLVVPTFLVVLPWLTDLGGL